MRLIKESFLKEAALQHPKAASYLARWRATVKHARWRSLNDLRQTYPSADEVALKSKKKVVVFNAGGNSYRLIVAVHFNQQRVYLLRFFTHAEYSKDEWKAQL